MIVLKYTLLKKGHGHSLGRGHSHDGHNGHYGHQYLVGILTRKSHISKIGLPLVTVWLTSITSGASCDIVALILYTDHCSVASLYFSNGHHPGIGHNLSIIAFIDFHTLRNAWYWKKLLTQLIISRSRFEGTVKDLFLNLVYPFPETYCGTTPFILNQLIQ